MLYWAKNYEMFFRQKYVRFIIRLRNNVSLLVTSLLTCLFEKTIAITNAETQKNKYIINFYLHQKIKESLQVNNPHFTATEKKCIGH